MIKTRGQALKIFNSWSNTKTEVQGFEAPEAFIFLYEKEKFLTLKEGRIEIWTSDGELLTNFAGQSLCSKIDLSADSTDANYIVSVSQSKRYLFAYQSVKQQHLINVIDIQKESLVASIRCNRSAGTKKITSLFFCERSNTLYVGNQDGEVELYAASTTKIGDLVLDCDESFELNE